MFSRRGSGWGCGLREEKRENELENENDFLMKLLRRLRALFRRDQLEREMREEMRLHLELQAEKNAAAGMEAEEARYAARRQFGGVEQIKETVRDQRGMRWFSDFTQDLRVGLRQLGKSRGLTLVAVFSLALGIGANTAIFGALDKTLLRSLAVRDPSRLVRFAWLSGPKGTTPSMSGDDFWQRDPVSGRVTGTIFSRSTFERIRAENAVLTDAFAFAESPALNLKIDGKLEGGAGQVVTGNYYQGLGVSSFRGRTIGPEDDRPEATPVAVMSYRFWKNRLGGDVAAIGRTITVNQIRVTLIGVMSPEFTDPLSVVSGEPELTFPIAMIGRLDPGALNGRTELFETSEFWWLRVMGRLQPGVTSEQAAAALGGVFQFAPQEAMVQKSDYPLLRVIPGGRGLLEIRQMNAKPLITLMGLVALVLLAAGINIANLLLAQGASRGREIAIRMALGAGRGRIVRQLLTESLLISLLGAALGLLFAKWAGQLFLLGENFSASLDWRVLTFTTMLALLTAVGFGLVPALRATRLELGSEFHGGARQLGRGARSRLSRGLLVAQVAISLVLLISAGLFVRTLSNLRRVDFGFNQSHLLLFTLDATSAGYKRGEATELFERVREHLESLPGVQAATFSDTPLLSSLMGNRVGRVEVVEPSHAVGTDANSAVTLDRIHGTDADIAMNPVAPNFFKTTEMALIRGRFLTAQDGPSMPKVAVINQAMSRRYFGDEDPIGRRFTVNSNTFEVVGVARDARYGSIRRDPWPTAFVPAAQMTFPVWQTFTVRTFDDPVGLFSTVRKAVAALNPDLVIKGLRTQEDELDNNLLHQERFVARLSTSVGLIALGLSCMGLYGLMSYAVSRRTSEIGLRMALGALPWTVLWMILRESLVLVAVGVVMGLIAAVAAGRIITEYLYGVSSTDPTIYAGVALLLFAIAAAAALLPARRAAKVDPVVALRTE